MSLDKKRVLIVANELSPYLELTDFAHILNKLAIKTFDAGIEIRVIMPRFGTINERRHKLHEVVRLSGINVIIDKDDYPLIIKVASLPNARLQVYFMDNEDYFKRKFEFRDDKENFYDDNADRMIFFAKSALETVKKFGWPPHVIHCHGWMSALVPAYLKTIYKDDPTFKNSKVVYSVYDDHFQNSLNADFAKKAIMNGMNAEHTQMYSEATNTALNLGAISYSDAVVYASENINEEVLKFVKKGNKPTLEFNSTSDYENYYNLYEEIVSEELISLV